MNMCDYITFEVPRLSTFVFKKSSEKNMFTIIFLVKTLNGSNGLGGPTLLHSNLLGQCIVLSG